MKKFCTRCGRKLEKDEVCTCEKIKKDKREVKNELSLIDKIFEFLKTPSKALKNINFLEGNEYIILILSSLSFGFLNCCCYFGRYFRNIISVAVLSFLFFVIFAFMISTIKKQIEYRESIKIVSISSIVLLCGNLLALLFSFLSPILTIIIILFSSLLFILFCYQGMIEQNDSEQNAYEFTLSLFTTVAILFLIIRFL